MWKATAPDLSSLGTVKKQFKEVEKAGFDSYCRTTLISFKYNLPQHPIIDVEGVESRIIGCKAL